MKKSALYTSVGSVVLLAATGLVFLWCCPETKWQAAMLGAHRPFWRQLAWNAVGVAAFCAVMKLGWSRVIKSAPYIAAAWTVMLLGAAFLCPEVNGEMYLWRGPVGIRVMALSPLVIALMLAWFSDTFRIRAYRLLQLMLVSFSLAMAVGIASDANRVERVKAILGGDVARRECAISESFLARSWAQKTCVDAFRESRWFSGNENYLRNNPLPGRVAFAMPVAASLTFGRWFLVLAGTGFALLLWCFVRVYCTTTGSAQRVFLVVAGLGVFGSAILGVCECLGIVPMLYFCVPLLSYDGTLAFSTWTAVGVVAAMEDDEKQISGDRRA